MWLLADLNLLKLKLPQALSALCHHQHLYSLALLKLKHLGATNTVDSRVHFTQYI